MGGGAAQKGFPFGLSTSIYPQAQWMYSVFMDASGCMCIYRSMLHSRHLTPEPLPASASYLPILPEANLNPQPQPPHREAPHHSLNLHSCPHFPDSLEPGLEEVTETPSSRSKRPALGQDWGAGQEGFPNNFPLQSWKSVP